jgi:polyisoprenyl-teichoic acid--peptidoglycan teichoic acid transferase
VSTLPPSAEPGATSHRPPGRRSRSRPARSFGAALGLTALGALVPGTAFLAAGRRKLGALTLLVLALVVGGGVWFATGGRRTAVRAAVDTNTLLWMVAGAVVLAVLWAVVVVAGYRMLVPPHLSRGRKVLGALVVLVLVTAVVGPA